MASTHPDQQLQAGNRRQTRSLEEAQVGVEVTRPLPSAVPELHPSAQHQELRHQSPALAAQEHSPPQVQLQDHSHSPIQPSEHPQPHPQGPPQEHPQQRLKMQSQERPKPPQKMQGEAPESHSESRHGGGHPPPDKKDESKRK